MRSFSSPVFFRLEEDDFSVDRLLLVFSFVADLDLDLDFDLEREADDEELPDDDERDLERDAAI